LLVIVTTVLRYRAACDGDHVVKFRGDRPRDLGDRVSD